MLKEITAYELERLIGILEPHNFGFITFFKEVFRKKKKRKFRKILKLFTKIDKGDSRIP